MLLISCHLNPPHMTLLLSGTTLFFHDITSRNEKPSGVLKVNRWVMGVGGADTNDTNRNRSHTFGSGSKDWPTTRSHVTSISSGSTHTPSTSIMNIGQESDNHPAVVQSFGGLELEDDDGGDYEFVIGRQGNNNAVRGVTSWPLQPLILVSLPVGSQSRRIL